MEYQACLENQCFFIDSVRYLATGKIDQNLCNQNTKSFPFAAFSKLLNSLYPKSKILQLIFPDNSYRHILLRNCADYPDRLF